MTSLLILTAMATIALAVPSGGVQPRCRMCAGKGRMPSGHKCQACGGSGK